MAKSPFTIKTEFYRYIDRQFQQNKALPSPAAFVLKRQDNGKKERYLSVNRADYESQKAIVQHYCATFEQGAKSIAVSVVAIKKYNKAAAEAGVELSFESLSKEWLYSDTDSKKSAAYLWTDGKPTHSHCGVNYLHHLDEIAEWKFANYMAQFCFKRVKST